MKQQEWVIYMRQARLAVKEVRPSTTGGGGYEACVAHRGRSMWDWGRTPQAAVRQAVTSYRDLPRLRC